MLGASRSLYTLIMLVGAGNAAADAVVTVSFVGTVTQANNAGAQVGAPISGILSYSADATPDGCGAGYCNYIHDIGDLTVYFGDQTLQYPFVVALVDHYVNGGRLEPPGVYDLLEFEYLGQPSGFVLNLADPTDTIFAQSYALPLTLSSSMFPVADFSFGIGGINGPFASSGAATISLVTQVPEPPPGMVAAFLLAYALLRRRSVRGNPIKSDKIPNYAKVHVV